MVSDTSGTAPVFTYTGAESLAFAALALLVGGRLVIATRLRRTMAPRAFER